MTLRIIRRLRATIRAINRAPGPDWQDQFAHHGIRVATVLGIALLMPFIFPRDTLPELDGLVEGAVPTEDVIAVISFPINKPEAQLERERRDAEARVPASLIFEPDAANRATNRAHDFFTRLNEAAIGLPPPTGEEVDLGSIRDILGEVGETNPSDEQLAFLADSATRGPLHIQMEDAFQTYLPLGVALDSDLDLVRSQAVIVRHPEGDERMPRDSILTADDFYELASLESDRPMELQYLYEALLTLFMEPSLRLDQESMARARQMAKESVDAAAGSVLEGELIVPARRRIGPEGVQRLDAYRDALVQHGLADQGTGFWHGLGVGLFGLVMLALLGVIIFYFRSDVYRDIRSFSVLFLLVLLVLVASGVIAATGTPATLIPIAFAALLIGALFDSLLAVLVVLVLAGIVAGQAAFAGLAAPFLTVAAGATAGLAVREVHRRSQSWVLIAVITAAYVTAGLALLLIGDIGWRELGAVAAWGFGSATASTALALGAALPGLEKLTRRTTDQTLLELADLNRPVLRRLSREAPGTYAHSINVANLSEAACDAIGADALLARVGTYYHDIGKLERPQFFIENQPKGLNPHDRLTPAQSAEVLRAHVRDGLRMAEEAKLPVVIKAFIREHHGTQRISYFFEKARREQPDEDLNPNDFCYPGPKPQTKETAVVMLADAVESASRTLSDPSPERIRSLIDKLVEARVTEDQLDESLLTMRDLRAVKREFAHVLTGLFHHRIDYAPEGHAAAESRAAEASEVEQALASDTGPAPEIDLPQPPVVGPAEPEPPVEGSVLPVERLWPRRSAG